MSCRTCIYLEVMPDKTGRKIPRKGNVYACLYQIPNDHQLPMSAVRYYGFKWPPIKNRMTPDDGEGCVQHLPRQAAPPRSYWGG